MKTMKYIALGVMAASMTYKYVFSSTFAEGFRLDGGFEREAVRHFLHLQTQLPHLPRHRTIRKLLCPYNL